MHHTLRFVIAVAILLAVTRVPDILAAGASQRRAVIPATGFPGSHQARLPVRVEFRKADGGWQMLRGGKPYYIKGAVYWEDPTGLIPLAGIAERGGNSVRSGGNHVRRILDEAERLGMTVTVGIPMHMEYVHKFNYSDAEAVARQFEAARRLVLELRDHPALLMWGVGNELPLFYTNKKVWDAVEQIADFIHKADGNHPAMTVVGDSPPLAEVAQDIARQCPSIDLLGVNAYADLPEVPGRIRQGGWDKPYCVTEWGPSGNWQVPKTAWGAAIEQTSTEKADLYRLHYEKTIASDKDRCVGSYVFFWQWKPEATQTWFGMFLGTGERTETVNLMQYLWSGAWPKNRAPRIGTLTVDGQSAAQSITLSPGSLHDGLLGVSDPDGDTLAFRWEVVPEVKGGVYAGMGEKHGTPIEGLFRQVDGRRVQFTAPGEPGEYRLFVFVFDGNGNAGTANLPFRVK